MASDRSRSVQKPIFENALLGAPDRRLAGLLSLVVLVLVALVGATDLSAPDSLPASANATEFSATRAAAHLSSFASHPRPIGTPEGDRARDYLVRELSDMGLEPEVQAGWGQSPLRSGNDESTLVGHVENVVATVPGSASTGRVFLVAHYDSTMNSPGASDDGAGVAAILEVVRALRLGPPLRNDVVVVFTDGEEPGMLGTAAFTGRHPLAQARGVVLNLEAGGSHGPSTLFETSPQNSCLVDAYASTPHPFGDSATVAFAAMTSHHTDLTVFSDAGFTGLTSGFFHGTTDYHTPQDSIANLSLASLQQHGANLLGLARTLGGDDLSASENTACGEVEFFTAFGRVVRYPVWFAISLATVGLLTLVIAVVVGRRRGLVSVRHLVVAFGSALLPAVVSAGLVYGLWQALVALRPGYADLALGDPYRPEAYRAAVIVTCAAVLAGWHVLTRRRIGSTALALGAVLWPAVLGLVTAIAAPGASFLFALPAFAAAVGLLVAVQLPPSRWLWRLSAATIGAAPSALFLPQLAWEMMAASGGIASGALVATLIVLLALPLVPLLNMMFASQHARRSSTSDSADVQRDRATGLLTDRATVTAAVLLVAGAALVGVGLGVDRFDAAHPRPAHLHYVLDADAQTATWVSRDRQPSEWTCRYVDCTGERESGSSTATGWHPWFVSRQVRTGPAAPARLAAPRVTVLDDRVDGGSRVVRMRVRSERDTPSMSLYVDRPVATAAVGDLAITDIATRADGPWAFGLEIHAPPTQGMVVTIRTTTTATIRLRVIDHAYGLDGVPGYTPRPSGVGTAMAPSDVVSVGRTYSLPR